MPSCDKAWKVFTEITFSWSYIENFTVRYWLLWEDKSPQKYRHPKEDRLLTSPQRSQLSVSCHPTLPLNTPDRSCYLRAPGPSPPSIGNSSGYALLSLTLLLSYFLMNSIYTKVILPAHWPLIFLNFSNVLVLHPASAMHPQVIP